MSSNRVERSWSRRDPGTQDSVRADRGFSFIELVMVVAVISILAALAVPHVHRVKMTAQENVALASVRTIFEAEALYQARFGRFGEFDGMIAEKFLDDSFLNGEKSGYLYEIAGASEIDFELRAVPVAYGDTGFKSYFIDATGVIRYTEDGSSPTADSPVWK